MATIANDLEALYVNGDRMPLGEDKGVVHFGDNTIEGNTAVDGATYVTRRATTPMIKATLIEPYNTTEAIRAMADTLVTVQAVTQQGRKYILANAHVSMDEGGVRDTSSMVPVTFVGNGFVQVSEG